jgi:hypothetical protein
LLLRRGNGIACPEPYTGVPNKTLSSAFPAIAARSPVAAGFLKNPVTPMALARVVLKLYKRISLLSCIKLTSFSQ